MAVAGIVGGGLWGLIPAFFKVKFNTNETLFTLMLNYIAMYFVSYLQDGPWRDPAANGFSKIQRFDANAALDKVAGIQCGWIVALILVVVVFVYLKFSKSGYEIGVVGVSKICRYECQKDHFKDDVFKWCDLWTGRYDPGKRFRCHTDYECGRRCRIYSDHRCMAVTAESFCDTDRFLPVCSTGEGK